MGQEPAVAHIVELAGRSGTQVKVLPRGARVGSEGGSADGSYRQAGASLFTLEVRLDELDLIPYRRRQQTASSMSS
jgi:hypothetical protein